MPTIPAPVPHRAFGVMVPRKRVLLLLGLVVLALALGGGWLVHRLTAGKAAAPALPQAPVIPTHVGTRKALLADEPRTYDAIPKPPPTPALPPALPPQGVPVTRPVQATTSPVSFAPRPAPGQNGVQPLAAPAGPSPAEIEARIRAAVAEKEAQLLGEHLRATQAQLAQQRAMQAMTPQAGAPQSLGAAAPPKKASRLWFAHLGASPSMNIPPAKPDATAGAEPEKDDPQTLIPRAQWAKPLQVEKVLFWDQPIIAELQTAINSDIPGEVRLKVLRDVVDRELRGVVIIPALTSIRGQQDGSARFGQERLNVSVDRMIFPDGTVVALPKSRLADPSGAAGLPAEVNNHYGKLALGLLFSVGFNIGTRYAAGQPTGFQPSIEQETAREAGQAVNREAQRIAEQFRVPPTLVVAPGTEVSLFASENINFSKLPVTVR